MPLYSAIKAVIDSEINTNGIQYITGAIHNTVFKQVIDAVGAAQVYLNPAITDNPGTPANPRAYIALPGTYTNFGGLTIDGTFGVLKWDGTSWTATNFYIPSPYDHYRIVTNQIISALTPYTTINTTESLGGYTAKAGQWVQIVNRRTGVFEHVQLEYDLNPGSNTILIVSYTFDNTYPLGAIVDPDPVLNMKWHSAVLTGDDVNNYIDLPAGWRMPPATCIDPAVWESILQVEINNVRAYRIDTPTAPLHFDLNASNRLRMEFADIMTSSDRVVVRALMPKYL